MKIVNLDRVRHLSNNLKIAQQGLTFIRKCDKEILSEYDIANSNKIQIPTIITDIVNSEITKEINAVVDKTLEEKIRLICNELKQLGVEV